MASIGRQIAEARKAKGITQDGLAQMINVSRSALAHWETDRTQPSEEMLALLSQALDCDFSASQGAEVIEASADAAEAPESNTATPEESEQADAPTATQEDNPPKKKPRRSLVAIVIAAVLLASCLCFVFARTRPTPESPLPATSEAVDTATVTKAFFRQPNPDLEGRTYLSLDCMLQTTKAQGVDVWAYTLNAHEKHDVAFSIQRIETYTFVGDAVDERSFDADFLSATVTPTEIEAGGDWSIMGGLPVDDKVRGIGFVIRGTDSTGESLSFVFYQPLAGE